MDRKAKDSGSKVRATEFGGYHFSKVKEALMFRWPADKDWPTELPMLGKLDQFLNKVVFYDAYGAPLEGAVGVPPRWDAVSDWFADSIQSSPEREALLKRAFVVVANPKE